jgi:CSLREA domain-containing protein
MPRLLRVSVASAAAVVFSLAIVLPVAAARPTSFGIAVNSPRNASPGRLTAVNVHLPVNAAAVDGRVLVSNDSAELIGVAPAGHGTALRPESVKSGYAFAAYGLRATHGRNVIALVMDPHVAGTISVRVLIDSLADARGNRLPTAAPVVSTLGSGSVTPAFAAPATAEVPSFAPLHAATPVRKLVGSGAMSAEDLAAARYAWETTRTNGVACGTAAPDANGDGCADAVDLQAVAAQLHGVRRSMRAMSAAALPPGRTYTVTSTADTPDARVGDGACADQGGHCTLRAAIQEADWDKGNDIIAFHIPGGGVPVIQLKSGLPLITSLAGTLTIDGYTQPGARVNSASILTNGRPGVEVRGNGENAGETLFYLTSGDNTIRGLILSDFYRGIMIDGNHAVDNRIVGNWIGFRANGANSANEYGVLVNTGAKSNHIGTPALADRNIIGNGKDAVNTYGPGTNGTVTQNNVFCINPGGGQATCGTGQDHNFGPKGGLIGGSGHNERNVIGPTLLQGVEYSHGWNPNRPPRKDNSAKYQINHNRMIDNWVGFRADGSYNPAFRSGQTGKEDNGQGINVYDGTNDTLVEGNYVSSAQDGIQVMAPNAKHNVIEGNYIGVSPRGQAAPMSGWGVKLRWQATYESIIGNTIRHAKSGGIGLVENTVYNCLLSRNIISDTNGPAIYLAPDPSHRTRGAETLPPIPVIRSATTKLVKGTGTAGATVEVYRADRSAGKYGLPVRYLGSARVDSAGRWSLSIAGLSAGDRVTALQYRSDQNTSQVARNLRVSAAN